MQRYAATEIREEENCGVNDGKPIVRLMANGDVEFSAGPVRPTDLVMFIADVMGIARGAKADKPDRPTSYTGMPPIKPLKKAGIRALSCLSD